MTPNDIEESLFRHQDMLSNLITNQEHFAKFTQQVHESWREIGTELELIKIRLRSLEASDDTK